MLDLGCGFGGAARWLRDQAGARVIGLDVERENCLRCRRVRPPLAVLRADACRPALRARSFDGALCWCVLGYVRRKALLLGELRRLLRPGGRFGADVYTVLDPQRYCARPAGMAHVLPAAAYRQLFAGAGLQLLREEDLSAQYRADYAAFLEDASRRREELAQHFGSALAEDALERFEANIQEVLQGRKGGMRFVVQRPGRLRGQRSLVSVISSSGSPGITAKSSSSKR